MDWLADLWAWAWARHQNPLSWYVRPLFILPLGYFAFRKSVRGIVLTVLALFSSMFWFPAPDSADPRAARFLEMEQQYLSEDWTWWKTAFLLLIPVWFVLLLGSFWRRSWVLGLVVFNGGAVLKVLWSFYFGGESAWSIIPPVLVGAVVCNTVVILYMRRREGDAARRTAQVDAVS